MTHLVPLGLVPFALEVDPFFDPLFSEEMVTASCPLLESETAKQMTSLVELDVRVRRTFQYSEPKVVILTHNDNPSHPRERHLQPHQSKIRGQR